MHAKLYIPFSNTNLDSHSSKVNDGNDEVCIANISPVERRKRLTFGIIQFAIGLVLLTILLIIGAGKLWRLTLILPFAAAAAGYFQARDKT